MVLGYPRAINTVTKLVPLSGKAGVSYIHVLPSTICWLQPCMQTHCTRAICYSSRGMLLLLSRFRSLWRSGSDLSRDCVPCGFVCNLIKLGDESGRQEAKAWLTPIAPAPLRISSAEWGSRGPRSTTSPNPLVRTLHKHIITVCCCMDNLHSYVNGASDLSFYGRASNP